MKIRVLDLALDDLRAGYLFYEKQDVGLGAYFLDSLFSDIDSLLVYAGVHPIYFGNYYRMLSKRFPYTIYYRLSGEEVLIYAALDCRQEPTRIDQRLR